jgi:hypothetical protein
MDCIDFLSDLWLDAKINRLDLAVHSSKTSIIEDIHGFLSLLVHLSKHQRIIDGV